MIPLRASQGKIEGMGGFWQIIKRWWAQLSCALFTILGTYASYAAKDNAWIVKASFTLAGACFVIAILQEWWIERSRRVEGEKKWEEGRPRLGLEALSYEGRNTWKEHNNPFTLYIKLLDGRVPTSVYFDPIQSKSGNFILQFGALPHIDPPVQKVLSFEVVEVGKAEAVQRDRELPYEYHRDRLLIFLADAPERSGEVDYPLVVRFLDRGDHREQTFHLRWDWATHSFRRDTT